MENFKNYSVLADELVNADATGWVLYDAECRLCTDTARRLAPLLHRHGLTPAPLQTPALRARVGLKAGEPLTEMKLLVDGSVFGGADAVVQIARRIWWAWPLYVLSFVPGARPLLRRMYRMIADRRNCISGRCEVRSPFAAVDWLPLPVFVAATWLLTVAAPAWIMCWSLIFALVWGAKWPIWRRAERRFGNAGVGRFMAFFLWPGMDATPFFNRNPVPPAAGRLEWFRAIAKVAFGAALVWTVTGWFASEPLLAGWVGMVGVVFLVHFGGFDVLRILYRRAGFAVEPIMRAPALARSLGEFWGRRWNLAFSDFAYDVGITPLKRRLGIAGATVVVFATSGVLHELVISVPARGGYGLPTMYFLLQGFGLAFERTRFARRLGLGHGLRGWLFTALITAGPAYWLFAPPFVHHVVLPMLDSLHAL